MNNKYKRKRSYFWLTTIYIAIGDVIELER